MAPPARGTVVDPLLREIVKRLVRAYSPERVYLFGSAARGDCGPDSDFDILVVVDDDAPKERRRSRAAYQALWGLERSGDIVVLTRSAFVRRAGIATSLPGIALREGRLLYAA